MFDDIESDFWKEQISVMQKNNLMRKDFDRIYMSDCAEKFEEFKRLHPEISIETTCSANHCVLEFFVTQDVKLRLFVQNQTKISFLQRSDGDLIKIADAKFPNNPFKEIVDFLSHRNEIKKHLLDLKEDMKIIQKRQNFATFFIEAYLDKKLGEKFQWQIQKNKKNLLIIISKMKDENEEMSFELDLEKDLKIQIDQQIQKF